MLILNGHRGPVYALAFSPDGQYLASVSPRRYFCTECHVPQQDVKPPVDNDFVDIDTLLSKAAPGSRR